MAALIWNKASAKNNSGSDQQAIPADIHPLYSNALHSMHVQMAVPLASPWRDFSLILLHTDQESCARLALTAHADRRAIGPSGAVEPLRAAARVAPFLVVDAVSHEAGVEGEGAAHIN